MLEFLKKILKKNPNEIEVADLGVFKFENKIGWKRTFEIDGFTVDLTIGSKGDLPSNEMIQTANFWISNWFTLYTKACEFLQNDFRNAKWIEEPDLPSAKDLIPSSIEILLEMDPSTSMIFFDCPGDERVWHVTFQGETPVECNFDH